MKHVTPLSEFEINEMAKSWPVGTIVKCNDMTDCSRKSAVKWESWKPSQASDVEGGGFYMKITESGRAWLVGKVLYENGFYYDTLSQLTRYDVRFRTKFAETPSEELKIFQEFDSEIQNIIKTKFFIEGKEDGILTNDGKTKEVSEGEYQVRSLNFKLTALFEEPVFVLFSTNSASKNFSVKLSTLKSFSKELDNEQIEVIAEWAGKQLGTTVEPTGKRFRITTYAIEASPGLTSFSAENFINKEQAERFVEKLKAEKLITFDSKTLKIVAKTGSERPSVDMDELGNYLKENGIIKSVKEFLTIKKGAVTGKKFGI